MQGGQGKKKRARGAAGLTAGRGKPESVPSPDKSKEAFIRDNNLWVVDVATGAEKQEALLQVLQGKPDLETYPAQGIKPTNGSLIWLVDQAAAGPMK